MATNVANVAFDESITIAVAFIEQVNSQSVTSVAKIEFGDHGVTFEDDNDTYRTFVPYENIKAIYQAI